MGNIERERERETEREREREKVSISKHLERSNRKREEKKIHTIYDMVKTIHGAKCI